MIMPEKLSLSDFVSRRLHPVKLTIKLLDYERQKGTEGDVVKVDAGVLQSAIHTMQLFVEDYEKLIEKSGSQTTGRPGANVERKFVGGSAPEAEKKGV